MFELQHKSCELQLKFDRTRLKKSHAPHMSYNVKDQSEKTYIIHDMYYGNIYKEPKRDTQVDHNARLFLRQSESSGCEDCVGTREGFSTCTDRLEDLAGGQTLATAKVHQERIQIAVEAVDRADGNKRENSHLSVRALVQLELLTGDCDGGDGTAGGGDGACTAKSREPDHDFVLSGAGGRCASEDVVSNIGDDVGASVVPGPSRGQRGDRGDSFLGDLGYDVGV